MILKEEDNDRTMTITLLCPTRWTVRAKSLRSIIDNYHTLQVLWEWSLENCFDTEIKARIRGVDTNMRTFEYVFGSYLGEVILRHSDNLSRSLQDPNLSAVEGRSIALATVRTLKSIRAEEDFDLFWEKVIKHGERLEADKPALPRKRRQPKTMTDYFGYGTGDCVFLPERLLPETIFRGVRQRHKLYRGTFRSGGFSDVCVDGARFTSSHERRNVRGGIERNRRIL